MTGPTVEWRIADAYASLREMPTASVDAVITDPPYGTGGMMHLGTRRGGGRAFIVAAWDRWDISWLPDALRVSRAPVALFLPQTQLPEMFARPDLPADWRLLLWVKADPCPLFSEKPPYAFEPILVLREKMVRSREWDYIQTAHGNEPGRHHNQKPVKVMQWLVRMLTLPGQTILDPFAGSGSTLAAARSLGRHSIGIDNDPECRRMAARRADLDTPALDRWTEAGAP